MDEHEFEARIKRVERADAVVRRLDPAIRSQAFAFLSDAGNADIEALVFLVLMSAMQDMQDDLRSIAAEVRALNEKRSRLRDLLDTLAREDEQLAERLRREYAELFVSSDDELSELTALRLQLAIDRRSKLIETLSNILKKLADSESSIVENLK